MPSPGPQRFTIFGAAGFIGGHLAARLRARGHHCDVPARDEILRAKGPLGHVVYCIGVTADFRSRPFDTIEAHTGLVAALLRAAQFDSFLYLSSTRLYRHARDGRETASFDMNPHDASQLYDLSKMAAECLCLSLDHPRVRTARLSNVYGPDFDSNNFLSSVLRDAARCGRVRLEVRPEASKDYVAIADVTEMLERIALDGRHRVYNVAAGENVSNGDIMADLHRLTGCAVEWAADAPTIEMPAISIDRLREEFAYAPRRLAGELPALAALFRERIAGGAGVNAREFVRNGTHA